MSSAILDAHPALPDTEPPDWEPETTHYYDPDEWPIAYCGLDLTDRAHECPDDNSCGCVLCVVCEALDAMWREGDDDE